MVRQSQSNDLCVLQDVKDYLFRGGGNQTNADDNLLQRIISGASEWIRQETSTEFTAGNVTEIRSGTGGRVMFVKRPPINSVTSVHIDGQSISAKSSNVADFINSSGYSFQANGSYISLSGNIFSRGIDNVQLIYNGGYNSIPFDLEQACIEMIGFTYRELDRLGMISKTLAGETITFSVEALSKRSWEVLQHYKSPIPKT